MRQKFTQVRRAHGLSKIHKNYNHLSLFCSIIDTKNTVHYDLLSTYHPYLIPLKKMSLQ